MSLTEPHPTHTMPSFTTHEFANVRKGARGVFQAGDTGAASGSH